LSAARSRKYELRAGESAAAGIERIALGRIDHALDELRGKGSPRFAESVHEARKDLKKLRSVLRLIRDGIGDEAYARENGRIRDAGRLLSGARDAQVKLQTIGSLRGHEGMPTKTNLRAFVQALEKERRAHSRAGEQRDEVVKQAIAEIRAARATVPEWAPSEGGWELFAGGFGRSYRRGRGWLADVREDPSDHNVHEWRKRVKDHWYHLRILRRLWPEEVGARADAADRLSELLGDHHDLAVLAEDARGRPELFKREQTLADLVAVTEARRAELLADALALGERLYAERRKALVRRFGSYWATWQAG
jgi:CHAD domain-containing protein